jgi:predicted glycosyltransferase
LLEELSRAGYNILYLPRYALDKAYADGIKNIYIPDKPINGLDACYYSDGVLTGAGTFAREAACLGVPSFSFFAGKSLLTVDKAMIRDSKMFFSRDVTELLSKLKASNRTEVDLKVQSCAGRSDIET